MNTYFSVLILLIFFKQLKAFNLKNNACGHLYNYPLWFISKNCYYNPDNDLDPPALIDKYGFKGEQYEIITKDGHILTTFRIIPKSEKKNKQPVILMHGLATNCKLFLANNNDSLALILAEAGYDVWLPNCRSTIYSNKHQFYKVTNSKFWDYGLDEIAEYDVKENIEFVANKTGKAGSIIYIAHSLGTTTLLMLITKDRQVQDMLKGFIAISPIVYMEGIPQLKLQLFFMPLIHKFFRSLGITGMRFQSRMFNNLILFSCRFSPYVCKFIFELLVGDWSSRIKPDNLLQIFATFPQGVSVRQLMQINQLGVSQVFGKFNYGKEENFLHYGQAEPPTYNLSNVTIPVYMYHGYSDIAVSANSMARLLIELGSKDKFTKLIPDEETKIKFNHIDFLFGSYIRELFYDELLKTISEKLKD